MTDDRRPHSRACSPTPHPHGQQCHSNCAVCSGRDSLATILGPPLEPPLEPLTWREQIDLILAGRDDEADELREQVRRLQGSLRDALAQVSYHRDQHAALVQGPVLTSAAKADTEAAFQRGVNHARTLYGANKYALNRDGIRGLGAASTSLSMAQTQIDEAVKSLSEDLPATDPGKD